MNQDVSHRQEFSGGSAPGDLERFTALVREHQAGLRAFVRALGVEADWVDDVSQEVFLVAYRKQAEFESGKEFGRWLRGIARRLVANERRKEARHSRLLEGAMADLLAGTDGTTESIVEEGFAPIVSAMNHCLGELPERSRALLCQRYEKGETAPALALAFDLSPAAVRQMLVRVRAAMKRCVEAKLAEGSR